MEKMLQAVLLTAYKNINHIQEVVDLLHDKKFVFFIHIDKKSQIQQNEINILLKNDNVKLVSREFSINWGGINHLRAILHLLSEALKDEGIEYFHLITGHDFPVKPSGYINSFMEENRGKEFMEVNKLPYFKWPGKGGVERLTLYNFYDLVDGRSGWGRRFINYSQKIQRRLGIKRRFSKDFPDLYGGSTYWSLSREFIMYVFNYMSNNPGYLRRFRYSFCSEEIFFQTLLYSSSFKDKVVNDNLRFIVWEERNGNFPANLDDSDYEQIMNSNALFARKFEYPVSENLLRKIKNSMK